jgi:hypothetical protein
VWRSGPWLTVYKPGFDERYQARVEGKDRQLSLAPSRMDAASRASLAESIGRLGCHDGKGDLIALTDPQGVLPALHTALASEIPKKPAPKMEVRLIQRKALQPAAAQ